jgi:hypothetical protein
MIPSYSVSWKNGGSAVGVSTNIRILTRRLVEPVYRAVLIPTLGLFGLMFGLGYSGII